MISYSNQIERKKTPFLLSKEISNFQNHRLLTATNFEFFPQKLLKSSLQPFGGYKKDQ